MQAWEMNVDGRREPIVHTAWDMLLMAAVYLYVHEGTQRGIAVLMLALAAMQDPGALTELTGSGQDELVPILERRGLRRGLAEPPWKLVPARGETLGFARHVPAQFLERAHRFVSEHRGPTTLWTALARALLRDPSDPFVEWTVRRVLWQAFSTDPFAAQLPVSAFARRLRPPRSIGRL